jgi:predicted O-methyltransferase YrrM
VALALPTDGTVIACDVSTEWTAVGQPFWRKAGVADRIDLRIGPGLETLDALLAAGEAGRFDFAFIDADKPNYPLYYERLLKLVRRGGLIAVDNTLALSGAPIIGDVPVVAASRREAALHSARQADAERVRRELQRQVPRILSRSELVHEPRGRSPTHRALA